MNEWVYGDYAHIMLCSSNSANGLYIEVVIIKCIWISSEHVQTKCMHSHNKQAICIIYKYCVHHQEISNTCHLQIFHVCQQHLIDSFKQPSQLVGPTGWFSLWNLSNGEMDRQCFYLPNSPFLKRDSCNNLPWFAC